MNKKFLTFYVTKLQNICEEMLADLKDEVVPKELLIDEVAESIGIILLMAGLTGIEPQQLYTIAQSKLRVHLTECMTQAIDEYFRGV